MKAFVRTKYGGPEVLSLQEIAKPTVNKGEVLVKVHANSINAADWHILRGEPAIARLSFGLFSPKRNVIGVDFAGVVEEIGEGVDDVKVGDKVYGETLEGGAFAEYMCVQASACAVISPDSNLTEMACIPVAGITAYQAIVTHGALKPNERVLINGAAGGVGHFAIQIAKARGAHVTAVCSASSAEFVKKVGADEVIAYDQRDIHSYAQTHDLVVDTYGNLHYSDFARMGKRGVLVGFTSIAHLAKTLISAKLRGYPLAQFTAEANRDDLNTLAKMVSEKKIKPHIAKSYSYLDIPKAIADIETMHTKGKLSINWIL